MFCKRLPRPQQARPRWVLHTSLQFVDEPQPKKVRIFLLVSALQACGLLGDLITGRKIHRDTESAGDDSTNKFAANTLISMYAKCQSLDEARAVFGRMKFRTASSWTSLILGYVERGDGELGLKLFHCLVAEGDGGCPRLDARVFVAALKACGCLAEKEPWQMVEGRAVKLKSLSEGMSVHSRAAELGFVSDRFVSNTLVDMYCKCGSVETAQGVLRDMVCPDVVSWTAIVLGHAENDREEEALELFSEMQASSVVPDALSYAAALKACLGMVTKSRHGSGNSVRDKVGKIQSQARTSGCDLDVRVASLLIDLYSKLGSLANARRVFESMSHESNPLLWSAMLLGYVENREPELALELFLSSAPNRLTCVAALKACVYLASKEEVETNSQQLGGLTVKMKSLNSGMLVHSHAVEAGLASDLFVANTLIDMYFKCGSLVDASIIFHRMPFRTVVSWNAVILGYAENKEELLALDLFQVMESEGCRPDALTFAAGLKACCNLSEKEPARRGLDGLTTKPVSLNRGTDLHLKAFASGYSTDKFVACSLVSMYSKCGNLVEAMNVFESIPSREVDAVALTSLMLACAENHQPELALKLLSEIQAPDPRAFAAAMKACASLAVLETIRNVHARIVKAGCESDLFLANCLVEVYGSSGGITSACIVFDSLPDTSVVTWHSLMAGYSRMGDTEQLVHLFHSFRAEGFRPNGVTFVYLVSACSHAGDIDRGVKLFQLMSSQYNIRPGVEHYLCIVDLFGRANQLHAAINVVETMPFKADALTWLTILGACQKWKNVNIGKRAFENLLKLGEEQDSVYALMANIYGSVGLWEEQSSVEAMRKERQRNKAVLFMSGG